MLPGNSHPQKWDDLSSQLLLFTSLFIVRKSQLRSQLGSQRITSVPTFSFPLNLCNRLAKIHMYPSVIYQHVVHFEIGFLTVFLLILTFPENVHSWLFHNSIHWRAQTPTRLLTGTHFPNNIPWSIFLKLPKPQQFLHCTISKEIIMLCPSVNIPSSIFFSFYFTTSKSICNI